MNFYMIKREFLSFLFFKIFDEFQKRHTLLDSSWRPRNLDDAIANQRFQAQNEDDLELFFTVLEFKSCLIWILCLEPLQTVGS